jgi:hypothetical protein
MVTTRLIMMTNTGNMNMKATFAGEKPALEDVYNAQCTQGFKANGFPQGVKIERIPDPSGVASDPVYIVTFKLQQSKDHH